MLTHLQLKAKVPHYSLFCKRAKEAAAGLPKLSNRKPTELIIDSSGFKILGEGEWKVKIHGSEKRRGWVKLHIGIDSKTQEIIVMEMTDDKVANSKVFPKLIDKAPKTIQRALADGAYDKANCRKVLLQRGIQGCIPPRRKGKIRGEEVFEERNTALQIVQGLGGDEEAFDLWKTLVGYHRRSLVETAFSNIEAETIFRCHVLNRMTSI